MARNIYRTNGAAAYDARRETAAPQIERPQLPEERPRPARRVRVKAKAEVSLFAVFGMAAAGFLLVLVIFGYVQLYEATAEVGRLRDELASVEAENQDLSARYEGKIDLAAIEERAIHELGMSQPASNQNVYLNLTGEDRGVLVTEDEPGFFQTLIEACTSGVKNLAGYLGNRGGE